MRRKFRFLLRLLAALALWGVLFSYALWVLTPKYPYGPANIRQFYRQEPGTVDVLAVGTSLCLEDINTNILWRENGIAAFDLGGVEQPYWNTWYYLKEALKTQKPRLILLDAKACSYTEEYQPRGKAILNTFGLRHLPARAGAIWHSVPHEEFFSYLTGFPVLHGNYPDVTAADFLLREDQGGVGENWKGFQAKEGCEPFARPDFPATRAATPLYPKEEEWLLAIFSLAQEAGIPLLVLALPEPMYPGEHGQYNSLWTLCEKQGIPYLNLNDPKTAPPIDYARDFADAWHLNVGGSVRLSAALSHYLSQAYALPDHHGEEAYASWEAGLAEFAAQYPDDL